MKADSGRPRMPEVIVVPAHELTPVAARALAEALRASLRSSGKCRFALSGGATPRPVYEALAAEPGIDWRQVEVFFGDERCVPLDDPGSNGRLANEALLGRLQPPAGRVHYVQGAEPPAIAAREYEEALGNSPLDLVLLGMGDDGHTASIFPDTVEEEPRRVVATRSPVAPHDRVSLTTRALNEARAVIFLVAGAKKAERVAEVFAQFEADRPRLPAARVRPAGVWQWILDDAAAARLSLKGGRS